MHTAVAAVSLLAAADDRHDENNHHHTTSNANVHEVLVVRLGRGLRSRRLRGLGSRRLSRRLGRRLGGLRSGLRSRRLSGRLSGRLSRGLSGRLSGGSRRLRGSARATNSADIRKRKRVLINSHRNGGGVEAQSGRRRLTDSLLDIGKGIMALLVVAGQIHDVVHLTGDKGSRAVVRSGRHLRRLEVDTVRKQVHRLGNVVGGRDVVVHGDGSNLRFGAAGLSHKHAHGERHPRRQLTHVSTHHNANVHSYS